MCLLKVLNSALHPALSFGRIRMCGRRRDTSKSIELCEDDESQAKQFMMRSAVGKLESVVGAGQSVRQGGMPF